MPRCQHHGASSRSLAACLTADLTVQTAKQRTSNCAGTAAWSIPRTNGEMDRCLKQQLRPFMRRFRAGLNTHCTHLRLSLAHRSSGLSKTATFSAQQKQNGIYGPFCTCRNCLTKKMLQDGASSSSTTWPCWGTVGLWYPQHDPPFFFGNCQPHLPTLNVTVHLETLFCYRNKFITCSAHLRTYGSVFFVLCSLNFIVYCIVIVRFDSFHCIERVWCFGMFTFSLKELTPQTVLRFGCILVKNILKLILKLIYNCLWL